MAIASAWDHNIHYHDFILSLVPSPYPRALDVGCGTGAFSMRLAELCSEVVALDCDPGVIADARDQNSHERITFVLGDVMTHSLARDSFDFIAAIASLHHLPLEPALARLKTLLRPGGVLVVIGLYRAQSLADYASAAVAFPVSRFLRAIKPAPGNSAPLRAPEQTLADIRTACRQILPGANLHRRLFFRYSLTWQKPS